MQLGTHNSLTSYRVKNWWFKPLNFTSRCQSKSVEEQIEAGCRFFDIRLRWYRGKLYAAHGIMIYDITFEEFLEKINSITTSTPIYFRVMYEDKIGFKGNLSYEEFVNKVVETINKVNPLLRNNLESMRAKSNFNHGTTFIQLPQRHIYHWQGIKQLFGLPYPKLCADILRTATNDYAICENSSTYYIIDFL